MPAMRHRQTSNLDPAPTCRTGTERDQNQLIDELPIRDQRLQQVDTIIAELQDKITQSNLHAHHNGTTDRPLFPSNNPLL